MNDPGIPTHQLIDSIEMKGDTEAFRKLDIASLDYRPGEFLSTFLIMADKYNNADACMKVYEELIGMYYIPNENEVYVLESMNSDARKMAIRYLLKSDSLGNQQAREKVLEFRKLGIMK